MHSPAAAARPGDDCVDAGPDPDSLTWGTSSPGIKAVYRKTEGRSLSESRRRLRLRPVSESGQTAKTHSEHMFSDVPLSRRKCFVSSYIGASLLDQQQRPAFGPLKRRSINMLT